MSPTFALVRTASLDERPLSRRTASLSMDCLSLVDVGSAKACSVCKLNRDNRGQPRPPRLLQTRLVGLASEARRVSTLRHSDTPTLRHCSTPVKEVHCQESPTLADTAPTLLRHCPDTARHPDTSVNRHCPDTAPTLPRHCSTLRHSDTAGLKAHLLTPKYWSNICHPTGRPYRSVCCSPGLRRAHHIKPSVIDRDPTRES